MAPENSVKGPGSSHGSRAPSFSRSLAQRREHLVPGLHAHGLAGDFAVLEVYERGYAHHAEARGQRGLRVHIHLADLGLPAEGHVHLVEYGRLHAAGAAPGGPEIPHALAAAGDLVEILGAEMLYSHVSLPF